MTGPARLLRWYPRRWRARYGEEFVAHIEDQLDGHRPSVAFRFSIIRGGLREQAHEVGLAGNHVPADKQLRTASLMVFGAWSAFVLAGASYSKAAEHFAEALPNGSRALPIDAFRGVIVLGLLSAVIVTAGSMVALPALVRFLRHGGWSVIRLHVVRACVLSVAIGLGAQGLSVWAHHLDSWQRNGGDFSYTVTVAAWALLVAGTVTQWTAAGILGASRLELGPSVLRFESLLAMALAGAIVAMTVLTALWGVAMIEHAPWFFSGRSSGIHLPPLSFQMLATAVLMAVAAITATVGLVRISRTRCEIR